MINEEMVEARMGGVLYLALKGLFDAGLKSFFVGGNCLNPGQIVNDIDVFTREPQGHVWELSVLPESNTPNAANYSFGGHTVQVCRYYRPDLKSLVDSFDFSHIMLGAEVGEVDGRMTVIEVYISPERLEAEQSGSGIYTGSEFPVSSMVRLLKYYKRGQIVEYWAKQAVFSILADFYRLGEMNTSGIVRQFDGVDLGTELDRNPGAVELLETMAQGGFGDQKT